MQKNREARDSATAICPAARGETCGSLGRVIPLTGLPHVLTDAAHPVNDVEHVQRVAALVGAQAFGLVTPTRAEYATAANRWLLRHAWAVLSYGGVEVHEVAIPVRLVDHHEGRWIATAGPCLLIPGEAVRELRTRVRQIADRLGHGRSVFHSPGGGLEATRHADGVLVAGEGVVPMDWTRAPRFDLAAAGISCAATAVLTP